MENQIQSFVIISSIFLGFFILITIYLIVKLKLNDIELKKSQEKLKNFNETLQEIVTERTRKLRESEREFRNLYELHREVLENSPAGIIKLNHNLEIDYENPQMLSILELIGDTPLSLNGMNINDISSFQSLLENNLLNDLINGNEISHETSLRSNTGKVKQVIIYGVPIFDDGVFIGAVLLVNDITELKNVEDKLKNSLHEKEILLKEVHHRVKNNMQIISSILKLQIEFIKDPIALEMSKNSHNRVRTMALVHEKIYQSSNLAQINFNDYLRSLAIYLLGYYGINSNKINLNINIQDILVDINLAIPCGLIANELISNSIKHAFTDKKEGEISVNLFIDNNGDYNFIVTDNGKKFEKIPDFSHPMTLGFQLVKSLVQQIHGKIEFQQEDKKTFSITFRNVMLSTYSGMANNNIKN